MTYTALARSAAAPKMFPSSLGVLGDKFDWFYVTKGEGGGSGWDLPLGHRLHLLLFEYWLLCLQERFKAEWREELD